MNPYSILKIDKWLLNDYNLNDCINDNIKYEASRYLLIEINPSLTELVYHHIKLHNKCKNIIKYEGSPFADDYNNKEYIFKVIKQIHDDASNDKLIILENLR